MLDIRSFSTFAVAAQAALAEAETKRTDVGLIKGIKENLKLFGLAGVFDGVNATERRLNHFLMKMMESKKVHDFAIVNSTKPNDMAKGQICFDIAIKPTVATSFVHAEMHIDRFGVII